LAAPAIAGHRPACSTKPLTVPIQRRLRSRKFSSHSPEKRHIGRYILFCASPVPAACACIVPRRDVARGPSAVDQIVWFLSTLWTAGNTYDKRSVKGARAWAAARRAGDPPRVGRAADARGWRRKRRTSG